MDAGYKYRAIGAILVMLGMICGIVGLKLNMFLYQTMFFILLFVGILLVTYGLTRIELKNYVKLQNLIRQTSRMDLIVFLALILLCVLAVVLVNLGAYVLAIIVFICASILGVWYRIMYRFSIWPTINDARTDAIIKMRDEKNKKLSRK